MEPKCQTRDVYCKKTSTKSYDMREGKSSKSYHNHSPLKSYDTKDCKAYGKSLVDSDDEQVELEWAKILKAPQVGSIQISSNPIARAICEGFRINHMIMRDADTGKVMWKSGEWNVDMYNGEQKAHVPASILQCRAVSREINFTSSESIDDFRLEQRVYFQGSCLEEWRFDFGFVIPGSTNTWQQTIESAGEGNMKEATSLDGKVTIETAFYNGKSFISKTVVRIFYD